MPRQESISKPEDVHEGLGRLLAVQGLHRAIETAEAALATSRHHLADLDQGPYIPPDGKVVEVKGSQSSPLKLQIFNGKEWVEPSPGSDAYHSAIESAGYGSGFQADHIARVRGSVWAINTDLQMRVSLELGNGAFVGEVNVAPAEIPS